MDKKDVNILYVDDEEANLFLFHVNFKDKYTVYTATSGIDGLEKLDAHHDEIVVVISDMRMPKMNGVEFIQQAKQKYENIIYFILTGFDYNDEIDEALKGETIQRFFTKPFEMDEIERAIDEAVAGLASQEKR